MSASADCGSTGLIHAHGAKHGPKLVASLAITLTFVLVEALAGVSSGSLALLADAGHNASDALALGLAAYAVWIARKPADHRKTYGYHRVAILTALFNAASLVGVAALILFEAVEALGHPRTISSGLMIWVAAASVLINTVIAWMLKDGAHDNLNMRAAFIHMVGDAASAAAVVVAGFIIRTTGWVLADTLASLLIGMFIVYTAWGVVKAAVDILLEAAPADIDVEALASAMEREPLVQHVHDMHVWVVGDGMRYMSCHVELPEGATIMDSTAVVEALSTLLASDFNIGHATIQTELAGTCHDGQTVRTRLCKED